MNSLILSQLRVSHDRSESFAVEIPSFALNGGAVHGLIGHNGSGKTTLALALAGLLPELIPGKVEGEIRINDSSIRSLPFRERLGLVGYSFQDAESQLLFGRVGEVLAIDDQEGDQMRLAVEALGATHLLERFPEELSGGEAQRVALLTALRRNPAVVIFDEATSALDPQARRDFASFIRCLRSDKRIILLLGQRADVLQPFCDSLSGLRRGRLVPPSEAGPDQGEPVSWSELQPTADADLRSSPRRWCVRDFQVRRHGRSDFVLGPVSLEVAPGEVVAILGANGCGKTTLLLALSGFLKACEGCVEFEDKQLSSSQWRSLRPPVGLVTQSPLNRIVGSSIAEELEINLGWKSATLDQSGWAKLMQRFDYLQLDRDPLELSYGQQRFLTLLESFLSAQPILLIDEPELGLDPQAIGQIETWLLSLKTSRARTVVFATHDLRLAASTADRCILMREGKIVAETKPANVEELEQWYFSAPFRHAP